MHGDSPMPRNRLKRKVAVMGYPYVGKSALVLRFVQGVFPEKYESTIEDQHCKNFDAIQREFLLKVTDTAGQQEYTVFPRSCALDTHGFVLMYAINNRKSFEMIAHIYNKILDAYRDSSMPVIVVGNKLDLEGERQVSRQEGAELARKWGAQFLEINCKDMAKVNDVFETLCREIEISRGNMTRKVENHQVPNGGKNSCVIA